MAESALYSQLKGNTALEIHHLGPDLSFGPLPALFYFALSGKESLTLDPFNQPALYMAEHGIRVFSFTLPGHEEGYSNKTAIAKWAEEIHSGKPLIKDFVDHARENIEDLIARNIIDSRHLGAAGLSRGGFVAAHLAAEEEKISALLGFAPMTCINYLHEFKDTSSASLDLIHLVDKLIEKKVKFYIGNRDSRVGTAESFRFIEALTEASYQAGHRSPPVEMLISPSIGHKGHGTPPHIFRDGIEWMKKQLMPEL